MEDENPDFATAVVCDDPAFAKSHTPLNLETQMAAFRIALLAAILPLGGLIPGTASGSMIGFTAQLHTNLDHFSISNDSDAGFTITDLEILLGDDAVFDTSTLSLGMLTDPGGDLMFTPVLETAIVDGATSASFDFSGFDSGDVFEFDVRFLNAAGASAAGSDLNNAVLAVTFSDGQTLQTTFSGGPTSPPASNRQAFMFSGSATAAEQAEIPSTPEPSSALLLMMGIIGLGGFARARRFRVRSDAMSV